MRPQKSTCVMQLILSFANVFHAYCKQVHFDIKDSFFKEIFVETFVDFKQECSGFLMDFSVTHLHNNFDQSFDSNQLYVEDFELGLESCNNLAVLLIYMNEE